MYDRALPFDDNAERALLGSVILGQQATLDEAREIVRYPEAFFREINRDIWRAIIDLSDKRISFDAVTLHNRLKETLEPYGGIKFLFELTNIVPHEKLAAQYASIVQEHFLRREKIRECEVTWDRLHDGDDPREVISQSMMADSELLQGDQRKKLEHIKGQTHTFMDFLESRMGKGGIVGIPTGYNELDRLTGGFEPGLIILGARPSVGKTTFALNLAVNVGAIKKIPVYIFSLEMSKEQLMQKLVAQIAKIDSDKFRWPELIKDEEWKRITDALNVLSESNIHIDDTPGLKVSDLGIKLRQAKTIYGQGLAIIDYLQLMRLDDKAANRYELVTEVSQGVKKVSMDLGMPIVALSQLNRALTDRKIKRPSLPDLRESGALEQDADVIMFLHRDDYAGEDGLPIANDNSETELLIEKARMSKIGIVKFMYFKPESRFVPMSLRKEPVGQSKSPAAGRDWA